MLGETLSNKFLVGKPRRFGTMGPAYAASEVESGRQVLVQQVNITFPTEDVLRRLEDARTIAARAPVACAQALAFEEDTEHGWYLVWDLTEGDTLLELTSKSPRISPLVVFELGRALFGSLSVLHDAGLCHFGLSPANVWIVGAAASARALLVGVGLYDPIPTANAGLPHSGLWRFLAPEQIDASTAGQTRARIPASREPPGARSDLYAAALILYQALSGQLPHSAKGMVQELEAKLTTSPRPLSEALGFRIAGEVDAFFMTALSTDPRQRFTNASATLAAWRALEKHMELAPLPEPSEDDLRARQITVLGTLVEQLKSGEPALPTDLFGDLLEELERRGDERSARAAWDDDSMGRITRIRPPGSSDRVELLDSAERDLESLTPDERHVVSRLLEDLADDPAPRGAQPLNDARRHVRVRIGRLRLLYCVRGGAIVAVRVLKDETP